MELLGRHTCREVDVGVENAFRIGHAVADLLAGGANHHGDALGGIVQDAARFLVQCCQGVAHMLIHKARGDDIEALALESMRPCADPYGIGEIIIATIFWISSGMDRWIVGDVDLLALGYQGKPGKGVGILPADQRADPA